MLLEPIEMSDVAAAEVKDSRGDDAGAASAARALKDQHVRAGVRLDRCASPGDAQADDDDVNGFLPGGDVVRPHHRDGIVHRVLPGIDSERSMAS